MKKKIILISGPRQVGKTTLAKTLMEKFEYFNYDLIQDRKLIHKAQVDFNSSPIILDEIHKMKNWKRWVKGYYDTRTHAHPIVVTGSAQLDTFKKVGDSLAGRFFQFRLMPLDLKEISKNLNEDPKSAMEKLLSLSGFPEPYLLSEEKEYKRWRTSHLNIIVRQDIANIEAIRNLNNLELLVELMTERVGSLVSYNSLREDLQTDDKSIKRWLNILENSYVLFKVSPYSKKINRAIAKSPKYYFYDIPRVSNPGARFENLVALSLLKEILYLNDTLGEDFSLHYLRNTMSQEVDFLVCRDKQPYLMIESKISENNLENSMDIFEKYIGKIPKIVLVKNLRREFILKNGARVLSAAEWLAKLNLLKEV